MEVSQLSSTISPLVFTVCEKNNKLKKDGKKVLIIEIIIKQRPKSPVELNKTRCKQTFITSAFNMEPTTTSAEDAAS